MRLSGISLTTSAPKSSYRPSFLLALAIGNASAIGSSAIRHHIRSIFERKPRAYSDTVEANDLLGRAEESVGASEERQQGKGEGYIAATAQQPVLQAENCRCAESVESKLSMQIDPRG